MFSGKRGHADLGEGEWKASGRGLSLFAPQRFAHVHTQLFFPAVKDLVSGFLISPGHFLRTRSNVQGGMRSVLQNPTKKICIFNLLFAASHNKTQLKLAAKSEAAKKTAPCEVTKGSN